MPDKKGAEVIQLPLAQLSGAYDLYNGIPPHEAGSDTSAEAARSILGGIGRLQALVLEVLVARGNIGATDDELEVRLGLKHQTVSARRRELVLKGLARNSGSTRPTRSGRPAAVWILGFDPTFCTDRKPLVVPSRDEITGAIQALRGAFIFANPPKHPRHDDMVKVMEWLKVLASTDG
jgi:hypothetical protein